MFALHFSTDYTGQEAIERQVRCIRNNETIQLQTSGSTGQPKQITYATSRFKTSARKTNAFFNLNSSTKAVLCLSPETIGGKMMITRAMEGNYEILAVQPTKRPLQSIEQTIDFIAMVPLQLRESLEHDLEKLKKIRTILVGGGPIPDDLNEKLSQNNVFVYHSFGMTETLSHIALRKVGYQQEDSFSALPGVHFSESDGQLIVHAPDLEIDKLETNDLVQLLSPTTFVWLGRKDFVINSGGYKLHPESLENRWSKFLNCPFFLWKEPDQKWGEKLVLFLENETWPEFSAIRLGKDFKTYELPKTYYLCTSFVYTESGKINRMLTAAQKPMDSLEKTF